MKKLLLIFLLLQNLNSFCQEKVLNNESIIKLFTAGLSKDILIKKIQTSTSDSFDISTEGLIFLKSKKIPDTVILVIIDKVTNKSSANNYSKNNNINVSTSRNENKSGVPPIGISYYDNKNNNHKLLPIAYPESKTERSTNNNSSILWMPNFSKDDDNFIEFKGNKSTVSINNNSPVFIYKSNHIFSGRDLEGIVLYYSLVKNTSRIIIADKKTNMVKPTVSLQDESTISINLEKKLPPGSYFFSIQNASFYEFDIVK
jgi:hypothetical protein